MDRPDVVIIGAGPTGLVAALLLARAGCAVLVLDRDGDPVPAAAEAAWRTWLRPGISQFRQAHVALPRWHRTVRSELPEVDSALRSLGGTEINLLDRFPLSCIGGWVAGDEDFTTVTARRPVLEAAVAAVAATEPLIEIRRGHRVTGLETDRRESRGDGDGSVRVVGVRLGPDIVRAGLVVDAAGTRTPVPGWLAALGIASVTERSSTALTYYTRHYRGPDGPPAHTGGLLTHHESFCVLTLPADADTWGLALVVSSDDRTTRSLRDPDVWEAAVRGAGIHPGWLAGQILTEVRPLAGLQDIVRDYAPGGVPVVDGLVPLGDAWATTAPFLGRGLSLGAVAAVALRDAYLAEAADGPRIETGYARLLEDRVRPYVAATIGFGRHRAAEMSAEAAGVAYRTEDPAWAASRALAAGSLADPVLLRAHARIASLLSTPAEVFADVAVRARLGPHFASPAYPADRPGRPTFLAAIKRRQSTTPEGVPA